MKKSQFINPYNFIPLGKKRATAEQPEDEKRLRGVIEYSLLTKTPLFIPDTNDIEIIEIIKKDEKKGDKVEEHKCYEFFSYGKSGKDETSQVKPVIPGSEIRGMLRSNYEILTNSCMSVVDREVILNRRSCELFKAGLLRKNEDGSYDLLGAMDCLWRTKSTNSTEDEKKWEKWYGKKRKCYIQKKFKEGQKVYFDYIEREVTKGRDTFNCKPLAMSVSKDRDVEKIEGYIIKGEESPGGPNQKHCCHIFTLKDAGDLIKEGVSTEVLWQCLNEYKKNKENVQDEYSYKEYAKQFAEFEKSGNGYFPVYYSKLKNEDEHVMLSPACITKEVYKHQMKDVLGGFGSCEGDSFCPACSLFGTLTKKKAVASRIRFSDLTCQDEECFDVDHITLQELSSPKLNNMEFYLKRPEGAVFWTYDYYIDAGGKIQSWNSPVINGRKFYWHQMETKLPKNVEKTGRNMTIHPVKEEVKFKGKLFFDGISEKELAQLLWLLNCGEGGELSDKLHGYKLGAGKPLGLGSVALNVDKVKIRRLEKREGCISLKEDEQKNSGQNIWSDQCFEKKIQDEVLPMFRKMTQFDLLKGKRVSYPMTEDQMEKNEFVQEGYEWFTNNHKIEGKGKMGNSRLQMRFGEYMEAMTPELQIVSGKQGNYVKTAAPKRQTEKKGTCVWFAQFELKDTAHIEKLKDLLGGGKDVVQKTGSWIQLDNLSELSNQYDAIALPRTTPDNIIRKAKKCFTNVYKATKSSGSKHDDGWEEC